MKDDAKAPSKRGRPVEHKLPDPIPDTPENIMKAFLKTPPKKRERSGSSCRNGTRNRPHSTGAVVTIGYNLLINRVIVASGTHDNYK